MIPEPASGLEHPPKCARHPCEDPVQGERRERLWGMLDRRERWGLSFRGKLAVAATALVTGWIIFVGIHPFMAVTQRVDSRTLVVEGWVHEFTFDAAAQEFKLGSYDRVFTTGGPMEGQGGYISDSHTYASLGASRLREDGIPDAALQMAPSRVMARDRTYSSAVALREWFRDHKVSVQSINVVTEGAHARRTWLLFQAAFGKEVKVGIISAASPDYDPNRWWHYSEGVREIIDESVAYVYAKVFFWPGARG